MLTRSEAAIPPSFCTEGKRKRGRKGGRRERGREGRRGERERREKEGKKRGKAGGKGEA